MIMKLLELRTILLKIYQKARFIINPLVKFVLGLFVFNWINDSIGFDPRFTSKLITLLLSAVCAVTPGGVLVFFAMVLSLLHVFAASKFLAALLLAAYAILYGFLMRFSPKQAIAAVAIPVLGKYNLHYCVPLVLGCISTPLSALACICGVFIYYTMDIVKIAATRQIEMNLDDILQLYTDIADAVMANKQMYITMIVFTLVIVAIFLIRKLSFDYAFIISVGAGVVTNILGFLIADLRFNVTVNVGKLILMSLISGVIACLVELMKRVLDYSAIERVQFEDDDYYYYVKAVPKVNVSIPRHNVKHMSDYGDNPDEEEYSGYDGDAGNDSYEEEDDYSYCDSSDSDVRYEEFDENDFSEGEKVEYDDEDLSEYGIRSIDADEDETEQTKGTSDEGYEVDMTLDDTDV